MTTVSLVLGSGGARGLAHIGLIHWLEENGYKIQSISDCSIGAVIGGIYAAGRLENYESWVRGVTRFDILSLLDIAWSSSGGLIKGDKLIETLTTLTGDLHIEDLPIRFTAVAMDIDHKKEVWFNDGPLFDAVRASISLPLFFTPHQYRGCRLIDGGVLNPVPIAPTFSDNTDLTIAVNLGGNDESRFEKQLSEAKVESGLSQKIRQYIDDLPVKFSNPRMLDLSAYEVAQNSFEAMQSTIARQKLASYPPDITIEFPGNICGTLEFDRAAELIDFGYRRTAELFARY